MTHFLIVYFKLAYATWFALGKVVKLEHIFVNIWTLTSTSMLVPTSSGHLESSTSSIFWNMFEKLVIKLMLECLCLELAALL